MQGKRRRSQVRSIGVISDTHGLLRPEAVGTLFGVELIIHAGDVGRPEVLKALEQIAPVKAVRGNVDRGEWAKKLPETEVVEIGKTLIYVLHDINKLDLDLAGSGFQAVIYGHSHQPSMKQRNAVLFLNPGSAGPRRFKLPVSVAMLQVDGNPLSARIIELKV